MNSKDKLEFLGFSSPAKRTARRRILLEKMRENQHRSFTCETCVGVCCTFSANSVRVTPLEALDLYSALCDAGAWTNDLLERIRCTIKRFRLDQPTPGDGRRSLLRRRYTCPLFMEKRYGCPIEAAAKPYGCLGFNPTRGAVSQGEGCRSDRSVLTRRESKEEFEINEKIRRELGWRWEKESIPVALCAVDESGVKLSVESSAANVVI